MTQTEIQNAQTEIDIFLHRMRAKYNMTFPDLIALLGKAITRVSYHCVDRGFGSEAAESAER